MYLPVFPTPPSPRTTILIDLGAIPIVADWLRRSEFVLDKLARAELTDLALTFELFIFEQFYNLEKKRPFTWGIRF